MIVSKCFIANCVRFWKEGKPKGCQDFTECDFFKLELMHFCKRNGNFQKHLKYKHISVNGYEYDILVNKMFIPLCKKSGCKYYDFCRMKHKNEVKINV